MYANNSIVNLCRYDDLDTYITTKALANFESLSERYHLVSTIPVGHTYIVQPNSIERGDLFSQKHI